MEIEKAKTVDAPLSTVFAQIPEIRQRTRKVMGKWD